MESTLEWIVSKDFWDEMELQLPEELLEDEGNKNYASMKMDEQMLHRRASGEELT